MTPEREAELREAVARAYCEACLIDPDKLTGPYNRDGWVGDPKPTWNSFIGHATAAINTLRSMGALADDEPKRPAEKEAAPTSKPE